MAQNEPQGMEAAAGGHSETTGSTGSRSGSESSGASARTGSSAAEGGEEARTPSGTTQTGTTQGGMSRREEQGQSGRRLARREGWDDPLSAFFGVSPFALFRRLSDDMDRMFFGGGQAAGNLAGLGMRFIPNIDVEERDDRIVVRADLPGVNLDDLEVQIEDDGVVIQGERRFDREDTRGGIRRFERSHGSFRRVVPLPPGANTDAAEARFENGVLEIDIPVQQQQRSRRLDVHSGGSPGTTSGTTSSDPTRH